MNAPIPMAHSMLDLVRILYLHPVAITLNHKVLLGRVQTTGGTMHLRSVRLGHIVLGIGSSLFHYGIIP